MGELEVPKAKNFYNSGAEMQRNLDRNGSEVKKSYSARDSGPGSIDTLVCFGCVRLPPRCPDELLQVPDPLPSARSFQPLSKVPWTVGLPWMVGAFFTRREAPTATLPRRASSGRGSPLADSTHPVPESIPAEGADPPREKRLPLPLSRPRAGIPPRLPMN